MSGGSYEYAYIKIVEELERWPAVLEKMAAQCREWAASDRADHRYDQATNAYVPTSIEERAQIIVRAILLERGAERLRKAIIGIIDLEEIMHDVEWVASGDMGVDDLMGPIKKESPT